MSNRLMVKEKMEIPDLMYFANLTNAHLEVAEVDIDNGEYNEGIKQLRYARVNIDELINVIEEYVKSKKD